MDSDGPVLQGLSVDEGIGASFLGSGCWELVLQQMGGLADVLGYFRATELGQSWATTQLAVSVLGSLWPGPVIALLYDVQLCLEITCMAKECFQ